MASTNWVDFRHKWNRLDDEKKLQTMIACMQMCNEYSQKALIIYQQNVQLLRLNQFLMQEQKNAYPLRHGDKVNPLLPAVRPPISLPSEGDIINMTLETGIDYRSINTS